MVRRGSAITHLREAILIVLRFLDKFRKTVQTESSYNARVPDILAQRIPPRALTLQIAFLTLWVFVSATSSQSLGGSAVSTSRENSSAFLATFDHIPSPNFGIVNCMIRDARGFLWFGTAKGLCRYDGYQVRVLRVGGTAQPTVGRAQGDPQYITSMIHQADSSLLVATYAGVWRFDPVTEQFTLLFPDTDLSKEKIKTVVEAPDGIVWIGTESRGLYTWNSRGVTLRQYIPEQGFSDNRITCLFFHSSGKLAIGTVGGLNLLDLSTSEVTRFRKGPESLWSDEVTSLCESDDGKLWIGTKEGLNVFDPQVNSMQRVTLPSPISHTVWAMVYDVTGTLWIATSELGLLQLRDGSFTVFETSDDPSRSLVSVRSLYLDPVTSTGSTRLLWVGTRSGVNKVLLSRNPFTRHIRNQHGLHLNRGAVLALHEDRNGILWVGLWGGGLNGLRAEGNSYRRVYNYTHSPANPASIPGNDVGALLEDRNGTLWIGTNGGLASLDPTRKEFTIIKHIAGDSASIISNGINDIHEDQSGTIWISTDEGLSRLIAGDPPHFTTYLHQSDDRHPIGGNQVSDIFEDRSGNLWVATYGRGLNRLEADGSFARFVHEPDSAGDKENLIYSVDEDREGMFWLSTHSGLIHFDPRTAVFRRIPIGQLYEAHIYDIKPLENGHLLLSTAIGLAGFNPQTHSFVRFDESRGMPFRELFSNISTDRRGKMLVGGIDGFTQFSPHELLTATSPPEIAITSFTIFDQELPAIVRSGNKIRLAYDQNFFSFSFAVLDYANPTRNRFSYRMLGVDERWIEAGTHNYASYTNLDPGSYVFQVRGCNSENVWNNAGTSISIDIAPPYWQRLWFRIIIVGVVIATTYAAYRYRLRKLMEVERLRLRIAEDLHDDIGSNLSTIAMASRSAQRAPELSAALKQKLSEIYDTAVSTSAGMKDIVWFIKPTDDTLDDLLLRMKDIVSSVLTDVQHNFETETGNPMRISIDFKRNFFLGFKEIITNVAKHASATHVHIKVWKLDGMLETIVRDNGKGFDPAIADMNRHGNGRVSLLHRAQAMGGICEISSAPGKGTTVRFSGKI